jgi:hypothetical protein
MRYTAVLPALPLILALPSRPVPAISPSSLDQSWIPDELRSWVGWALYGQDAAVCPSWGLGPCQ